MERNLKVYAKTVDQNVINQTDKLLHLKPFSDSKVRLMPDTHAGKGSVIGFTSTYNNKVIPNIVGVDIGCQMSLYKYKLHSKFNLEDFDNYVKQHITSGTNVSNRRTNKFDLENKLLCWNDIKNKQWVLNSSASIGSGNHFIEIDKCEEHGDEYIYLVIHSGSRNLGKQVCEIYQKIAHDNFYTQNDNEELNKLIKSIVEKYQSMNGYSRENKELISEMKQEIEISRNKYFSNGLDDGTLPPNDLEWLEGQQCQDYLHDMELCKEFSNENHNNMWYELNVFLSQYGTLEDKFNSMHNHIDTKQGIIRKGATDASLGNRLIIPMNMRDGSLVCIGKGNEDWNYSAPHGAGRIMSRSEAFKKLNVEEFKESMTGIFTTTANENTLDESPMVYKNMNEIIECIQPTCDIQYIIKPIYNFKGNDTLPMWMTKKRNKEKTNG